MIQAHNLSFRYKETPVLDNISFHLSKGSLCGVLGPNGSGKTTLLKCLLGILPPLEGTVKIDGKNTLGMSLKKRSRHAAYVPQETKQFSTSTVFETVLLGRKPYFGTTPSKRDIHITSDILAELDLEPLAMRPVHTLSGGQRQRVCIAKALCQQTPVIILDEPTANLDLRFKIEVMHLLQHLAEQGKTILFSVHDISIPRAFCSDILLMKEGRNIAWGGKEILDQSAIENLYNVAYDDARFLIASDFLEEEPSFVGNLGNENIFN